MSSQLPWGAALPSLPGLERNLTGRRGSLSGGSRRGQDKSVLFAKPTLETPPARPGRRCASLPASALGQGSRTKTLLPSGSSPVCPGLPCPPSLRLLLLLDSTTPHVCTSSIPAPSSAPLKKGSQGCSRGAGKRGGAGGGGRPQGRNPALEEEKWNVVSIPKLRSLERLWRGTDTCLTALFQSARSNILEDLRQMWREL